jgi:protein ImuB
MKPIRRLALRCVDRTADLTPVLAGLAQIAPRFEVIDPSWLMIPTRGPSRYFGGDLAVAERVRDLVIADGTPCGIGVADGYLAANVAALQSIHGHRDAPEPVVVPPGGSQRYLAPLSIGRLVQLGDLPVEFGDVMVRLGVLTCGDLVRLPAERLSARFGLVGEQAHRLAVGDDRAPLVTATPAPDRSVQVVFEQPVLQADPVVFAAKRLADPLIEGFLRDGCVCTRFTAMIETEHGERSERSWYLDRGFGVAAVVQRIRWQLDAWMNEPGAVTAGVVLVRLVPDQIRAGTGEQTRLWGQRSRADDDATRAIARLGALVGEAAVRVPVWSGGRLIHERYRLLPATSVDDADVHTTHHREAWRGALGVPSPAMVHAQPRAIEVLDGEDRPIVVSGRGELSGTPSLMVIGGERRRIIDWAGPWLIDQRWWSSGGRRRLAQMQVIDQAKGAHLLWRREQLWWLAADYA